MQGGELAVGHVLLYSTVLTVVSRGMLCGSPEDFKKGLLELTVSGGHGDGI